MEQVNASSKIKVLLISTNSDQAGAPLHVETLINSLKNEVDFSVIFGEDGTVASRLKKSNITVHILPEMRSKISPFHDYVAYRKISKYVI